MDGPKAALNLCCSCVRCVRRHRIYLQFGSDTPSSFPLFPYSGQGSRREPVLIFIFPRFFPCFFHTQSLTAVRFATTPLPTPGRWHVTTPTAPVAAAAPAATSTPLSPCIVMLSFCDSIYAYCLTSFVSNILLALFISRTSVILVTTLLPVTVP
jgi:hypothetical protein